MKLCIILVLALLLLAACGEKKSPYQVDYDFFWDTVEENYPYAAAIERINGKSLAEVREKYAPAAAEAQSAEELHLVLQSCMAEFPELTGHFDILGEGVYQTYMDIIARSPGQGKYEFMKKSLDTRQSRAFSGDKEPVAEGGEVESRKVTGNLNIFWARIEEKGYQDCIIDIRGNGGGSDTYWRRNIVAPNIDSEMFSVFCKDTGFATLVGTPIGTTPDVLYKPGEDALELCLDIIKARGGEKK